MDVTADSYRSRIGAAADRGRSHLETLVRVRVATAR
jgi:hypothetical protein